MNKKVLLLVICAYFGALASLGAVELKYEGNKIDEDSPMDFIEPQAQAANLLDQMHRDEESPKEIKKIEVAAPIQDVLSTKKEAPLPLLKTVYSLLVVFSVIGVLYFLVRKLSSGSSGVKSFAKNDPILKILQTLPLGWKQNMVVVSHGVDRLILGVSATDVKILHVFSTVKSSEKSEVVQKTIRPERHEVKVEMIDDVPDLPAHIMNSYSKIHAQAQDDVVSESEQVTSKVKSAMKGLRSLKQKSPNESSIKGWSLTA